MGDPNASNILFIFSDQHARRALGCLGHPVFRTPHLDRLAERGTLFRHAYTNGPICVPARASLATGRPIFEIGKWDNCKPYIGEEPSWGHRLRERGHVAGSVGKLHYRNETDPTGFDPQLLPMHILEGTGMLFTICRDPMPVSRKFAHLVQTSGEGHSTYTRYDHDITERSLRWIQEEGTRQDRPWALFVSLVCPHPPWNAPEQVIRIKRTWQSELFFVGVDHDQLIGTVLAGFDGVRGWIHKLAVAPEHRGRGIAAAAAHARRNARHKGRRRLGRHLHRILFDPPDLRRSIIPLREPLG